MPRSTTTNTDDEIGDATLRRYVNHLTVAVGLSEIELGFGQYFGPSVEPRVHDWLVTSPVHLVSFRGVIDDAITRYEVVYGRIPNALDVPSTGETQ